MNEARVKRLAPWWFVGFGSIATLGLAGLLGGGTWVERAAVIGTAVGTLALALATQALATRTEQSVRHSAELAETGREQLRTATQELAAARDEAKAAARAARAAEQARVDALAPLLTASISSGFVMTQTGAGPNARAVRVTASAPLSGDLSRQHVFMPCVLDLENIGRLPATVTIALQSEAIHGRIVRHQPLIVRNIVLERKEDEIIPLPGAGFVVGAQERIPVRFTVSAAAEDLAQAVDIAFALNVSGPLAAASDVLTIRARVSLLVDRGAGFIPHEAPVQIVEHRLERSYAEDVEAPAVAASTT